MTLAFDPAELTLPRGHYIGGRYVPARDQITVTAPSNGATLSAVPQADMAVVDRAVEAARTALRTSGWGRAAPRERLRALHRWADLMEEEAPYWPGWKRSVQAAPCPTRWPGTSP